MRTGSSTFWIAFLFLCVKTVTFVPVYVTSYNNGMDVFCRIINERIFKLNFSGKWQFTKTDGYFTRQKSHTLLSKTSFFSYIGSYTRNLNDLSITCWWVRSNGWSSSCCFCLGSLIWNITNIHCEKRIFSNNFCNFKLKSSLEYI